MEIRKIYKDILNLFLGVFSVFFFLLVLIIPFKIALIFGKILGKLAYCLLKKPKIIMSDNLKYINKNISEEEIKRISKNVFIHFGMSVIEFFSLAKFSKKFINNYIEVENIDYFKYIYKKGTPLIWLSAHVGNWEILNYYLGKNGYPMNVIGRKVNNKIFNWLLIKIREKSSSRCILRGDESAREIISAIKKKEIVGFLIDQDTTRVPEVYADFLGKPAYTPVGIAVISKKFDIPVLPGFLIRKGKKYVLTFYNSIIPKDKNINMLIQEYNNCISDIISKNPEQWVWFHERWKTKNVIEEKK